VKQRALRAVTIVDALRDPQLLGGLPAFRDLSTWAAWIAFLKAFYGLALDAAELALFRQHTARQAPRTGGYAEACAIVGVQSGKSCIAGAVGAFEAAIRAAATSRQGRTLYLPLIAQDLRGAQRVLFGYVRSAFEAPLLHQMIVRETADALELENGTTVAVYPCRPSAVRGIGAPLVIVDELAFFVATDGRPTDREMLRAVRGRVAATGGRVLILSSPYGAAGALYDLHRQHYGREDALTLVWQGAAPQMNPTLPAEYLERMAQDDPDAYRSEVLGEFRAGLSTFLDPEALDAVVARGVRERAPEPGLRYAGFADPSGGRSDAFTAAVAHLDSSRVAVLDALRAWAPPFNPSGVVAEAAAFFRSYGVTTARGDKYAAEFVSEAFRANGIRYEPSELDRSGIYLELLPLVNSGRVRLLDLPELLREFRGLERRRGTAGRDRVDHGPRGHDDQANAVAGVLTLLGHTTGGANLIEYYRRLNEKFRQEAVVAAQPRKPVVTVGDLMAAESAARSVDAMQLDVAPARVVKPSSSFYEAAELQGRSGVPEPVGAPKPAPSTYRDGNTIVTRYGPTPFHPRSTHRR
jgi:hypothetical protein